MAAGRARIERGAAVDLGGIGKGFSAGAPSGRCATPGPRFRAGSSTSAATSPSGALPPDRGPWRIAIADPRGDGTTLGVLRLEQGGVATSGRDARRFGPARTLHHLIDPATGAPAVAGPLAVTVVAADAAEAEGHATALAISSLPEARAHLAAHPDLAALYVPTGERRR